MFRKKEDGLLSIFATLNPIYQDLLHDMGESEECLFDGESLFLESVLDARCPAAFSGAPLQLIYYVERLLTNLHVHGGCYRVVFFHEYRLIWQTIPEVAALREILIAHLCRTLPPRAVRVLHRWWLLSRQPAEGTPSQEFDLQLDSMHPAFVLVSTLIAELPGANGDGGAEAAAGAASAFARRSTGYAKPWGHLHDMVELRRKLLLSQELQMVSELCIGLALWCLKRNVAVVPLSSLDFDVATRPFGFFYAPGECVGQFQMRSHYDAAMAALIARLPSHNDTCLGTNRVSAVDRMARSPYAEEGDSVALRALQYMVPGSPAGSAVTPRAALAAAVVVSLHGRASGDTDVWKWSEGELWLCEAYLLHAVLLDYSSLEDRALAVPYGSLQALYGASPPWAGTEAAVLGRKASRQHAIAVAPTPAPLSVLMQNFLSRKLLPCISNAVNSRVWEEAACAVGDRTNKPTVETATEQDGGGADFCRKATQCASSPLPQLPRSFLPVVKAALADPYQGPLLQAVVVSLLAMRDMIMQQQTDAEQGAARRAAGNINDDASVTNLLDLPPAATETWLAARKLAGLPTTMAFTGHDEGGTHHGHQSSLRFSDWKRKAVEGDLLIRWIVETMPYTNADMRCATELRSLLLGPDARELRGDQRDGSGADHVFSDGEGLGPAAQLDCKAQQALIEAFRLPESIRRSPVVAAVDRMWQRIAQQEPAVAEAPVSAAQAVTAGAAATICTTDTCDGPIAMSCSETTMATAASAAAAAATATPGCWGPWEHLIVPVLMSGTSGGGGSDSGTGSAFKLGHIEEVYHWHSRQPLMPAFLMQSESRDIQKRRLLKEIHMMPGNGPYRQFRRWIPRSIFYKILREDEKLEDPRRGDKLKALLLEGVSQYFVMQDQKEAAAMKRLIDSLQGGVTFFRSVSSTRSAVCTAASSVKDPSSSTERQHQELPLVIYSLDQVLSVAHLEYICQDREGKATLTALLRDAKMSAADLKRRLNKVNVVRVSGQQLAAERHRGVLQSAMERWNYAVMPHLTKERGERLDDALEALQRFCSAASTAPEFQSVAAVLQMQLHMASLQRLQFVRPSCDQKGNAAAGGRSSDSDKNSSDCVGGSRPGSNEVGGSSNSSGRRSRRDEMVSTSAVPTRPVLSNHFSEQFGDVVGDAVCAAAEVLQPGGKSGMKGAHGVVDGSGGGGSSSSRSQAAAVELQGGELPAAMQREIASLLQALASFKAVCRAGTRALWLQPCPVLDSQGSAAPCLTIVAAVMETLGFGEAAERLRQEAGFTVSELLDHAKVMKTRLNEMSDHDTRGKLGGISSQASSSGARAKAKTAVSGKGGTVSSREASSEDASSNPSSAGDLCIVDDIMLSAYNKIISSKLCFKPHPLGISLVRFQLRWMGDRLERLSSGVPDPRVGFIPDHWQRRLLNIVDSGESAVVSAPTSSGKTFISSYVVRKVLDAHGGRGRVVIVVPTKVLVLQISAQIAKDLHSVRNLPDGMVVYGTFTKDFRQNTFNSLALVTVPQCLEILLLSSARLDWVASLKYIIFDEVHCITEHGVGEFWERSLIGSRCPFLAFSATIGNPEVFTAWLRRVKAIQQLHDDEKLQVETAGLKGQYSALRQPPRLPARYASSSSSSSSSYNVHMILHKERYNDVVSSIFLPTPNTIGRPARPARSQPSRRVEAGAKATAKSNATTGPLPPAIQQVGGLEGCDGRGDGLGFILPLHPVISIDLDRVAHTGRLPHGLSMTPEEILQLYDAMVCQAIAVAELASAHSAAVRNESNLGGSASAKTDDLATAAATVRKRLAALDPERVFAPLNPTTMPDLDPAMIPFLDPLSGSPPSVVEDEAVRGSCEFTGVGTPGGGSRSSTCVAQGNSLVVRDMVKVWEKLMLQELLLWACSTSSPAASFLAHTATTAATTTATAAISAAASASGSAATTAARSASLRTLQSGRPRLQDDDVTCRSLPIQLYGPWNVCLSAIQKDLRMNVCARQSTAVQQAWASMTDGDKVNDSRILYQNLPELVRTLHHEQKLPAIVFNFSRGGVEKLGRTLVQHLEEVQDRYRQHYAVELERASKSAARVTHTSHPHKSSVRVRAANKEYLDDPDPGPEAEGRMRTILIKGLTFSLNPSRPDPSFSLIPFSHMDDERLLSAIEDLLEEVEQQRVNLSLVRALEFGVGVHHGGLNKRYRTTVETLFRAKILQVVIATGTLAMGVHMPCRTVVMAGDSPHLDALNFRQMSGRSGRRGLDTLGHVVFFGIPLYRVHLLRTSPMPRLHGQMLVTPTTTLRLLLLEEQLHLRSVGGAPLSATAVARKSGNGAVGTRAVDLTLKILSEPFMAVLDAPLYNITSTLGSTAPTAPSLLSAAADAHIVRQAPPLPLPLPQIVATRRRNLMRHTLGLSLVYLLRNSLVDTATGQVKGLAGLATHLFWTEPANLVLCHLIHEGVFAQMCEQLRGQALMDEAMKVLAHLFMRTPLSPNLAYLVNSGAFSGTTSSIVQLRPMLPEAVACINQYNQEIFAAAVGYVLEFVQQQQQEHLRTKAPGSTLISDNTLPLSGLVFRAASGNGAAGTTDSENISGGGGGGSGASAAAGSLRWCLSRMRRNLVACSPFMALCGRGDDFDSVAEMLMCVRQGVELQSRAIPVLKIHTRRQGVEVPLNAWMYDFYKNGSMKTLVCDNQIREGDVWDMLTSARAVLMAAALALELAVEAATSQQKTLENDEENLADQLEGICNSGSAAGGRVRGGDAGVNTFESDLQQLQNTPPPSSWAAAALHSAKLVALLFRVIAQKFSEGITFVGA